ncbi:four helix bundle protein [Candidatus Bipolaricaulota bacterium]|nr:four helix bundle protein [Candidatus Bipolaricaulota bacterium]
MSYRDLVVWQKAMALVSAIYKLTASFPGSERFGLTSQIQRAAVSVPSNIAEGQGRLSTKEFRQFLGIARGSLKELETQLLISIDLAYAGAEEVDECLGLADEVGRMLNALIKALERKSSG